jgi:hypothetical protein
MALHLVLLRAIREGCRSGCGLEAARWCSPVGALRCLWRNGSIEPGSRCAIPLCSGGVCRTTTSCPLTYSPEQSTGFR